MSCGDRGVFGNTRRIGEGVVGNQDGAAGFFGKGDAEGAFRKDGVVDDLQISNDRALVIARGDSFAAGIENDVVADDGIGGGLNAVVAGVPNDVALDDVGSLAVGVVDDDAGIVCIVNDVVADDVAVAAVLEFDAVALAYGAAFEIVDVVVLDDGVENIAVG